MANKRQRKKQQTQQNIKLLHDAGIKNKKLIKQIKNNPKQVQTIYKKENRNKIARERTDYITKVLGLKMDKENRSKRYWSQKRWDEWVQQQEKKRRDQEKRRKKKEDSLNDLYLTIFWRDKTAEGYAFSDAVDEYKRAFRYVSNEGLIENILKILRSPKPIGLAIGQAQSSLVKGRNLNQYINFMQHTSYNSMSYSDINDWTLVYKGKAVRYHEVLLAIHTVINLLYDASERAEFISTILDRDLPQINKRMAVRLAKDLNYRRF